MIYGQTVAQGVVEEKTSRVVELLLATVRPWQLMPGKVSASARPGWCRWCWSRRTGDRRRADRRADHAARPSRSPSCGRSSGSSWASRCSRCCSRPPVRWSPGRRTRRRDRADPDADHPVRHRRSRAAIDPTNTPVGGVARPVLLADPDAGRGSRWASPRRGRSRSRWSSRSCRRSCWSCSPVGSTRTRCCAPAPGSGCATRSAGPADRLAGRQPVKPAVIASCAVRNQTSAFVLP